MSNINLVSQISHILLLVINNLRTVLLVINNLRTVLYYKQSTDGHEHQQEHTV